MSGFLRGVTPVILTFDERENLDRTLAALAWAEEIVVVDSGSRDGTCERLAREPRARVFTRPFDSHARQWTFACQETGIASEWILALDADYVLTPPLVAEMAGLEPPSDVVGYRTTFRYCVNGHPVRASLYAPQVRLYRRGRGRYVQDGHTQRLLVDGRVVDLAGCIHHDDRKPLARWLAAQDKYARLEAVKLRSATGGLPLADRLRRLVVVAPVAAFFYCLIVKRGILDGRAGWVYAFQRAIAEAILSLHLLGGEAGS